MNVFEMTGHQLKDLLSKKEISAEELTSAFLGRIEQVDGTIRAYLTLTPEEALAAARDVDRRRAAGEPLPALAGLPMGIKDNISTRGVRTSCGSQMLETYVPPYDASVVQRLQEAGGIMLGKMNMDEFGMGSSNENSWFYPTRNPWDTDRVPGGSSGGSAAAVAAGEAVFTLGSDTGGSIRQPASFCGVVGLKPTYGRVSRYGLIAYACSLDQIGPFTRDVTDAAMVLEAIAGHDSRDSTSADVPVERFTDALHKDVKGLRIGVPREYFGEGLDGATKDLVRQAIRKYEQMGAVVEECSLPHTDHALAAYYIIAPAECSSNLARFDGIRHGYRTSQATDVLEMFMNTRAEGFGREVKKRIMLGTYALSAGYYDAYYLKALKVRNLVKADFDRAFEKYDVLMTPTATNPAFRLGDKSQDDLSMYLQDICTVTINLAGVPAMSVPCGFQDGMPVGLQLIGKHFGESTLIRAAHAFEQMTDYGKNRPVLEVQA